MSRLVEARCSLFGGERESLTTGVAGIGARRILLAVEWLSKSHNVLDFSLKLDLYLIFGITALEDRQIG